MLKKYNEREKDVCEDTEEVTMSTIVTVVNDYENGEEEDELVVRYNGKKKGRYREVLINPNLNDEKKKELIRKGIRLKKWRH